MRNLFIEEWKEDEEESSQINYEHLENFYDTLFHVPVYKKRIDKVNLKFYTKYKKNTDYFSKTP